MTMTMAHNLVVAPRTIQALLVRSFAFDEGHTAAATDRTDRAAAGGQLQRGKAGDAQAADRRGREQNLEARTAHLREDPPVGEPPTQRSPLWPSVFCVVELHGMNRN